MPTIWCLTETRYLRQRMPGAMIAWLRERGHDVRVVVADEQVVRVRGRTVDSPWQGLEEGDVVVARARHRLALALLDAAGRHRARVLTPWAGVAAVRNKARCADLLALHGLPTPETLLAAGPAALAGLDPSCFPLVLKPHLGDNAAGVVVVPTADALADLDWDDGLVLAQRWVDTGGWDVKVYVCGDDVWAVRRPSPLGSDHATGTAEPLPVDAELRWIARTCRDAFKLPLCGIDLVVSERGPLVVDVNDFPNYTGVAEAPGRLGALVGRSLERAAAQPGGVPACTS